MRHLTKVVMTGIILMTHNVSSQTCLDCRYISPIFDSVTVETVQFGSGPKADGSMQNLYMDIYQPHGDTATNRAVAIFAFGGAFIAGSRNDWYVELVCEFLAKTGYVAVAIDYRIYDNLTQMIGEIVGAFPPQQMRIFFRPMQDMRGAVQYMKADFSELGNNYFIDTSKILIGGASSGAMTSMMTAYCDKESEMAEMGFGSLTPLNALGGFYSTSGLYPNYNWNVLATFNVAGSIVNTDWIEPGDVPIILAHGDDDQIVPYKDGGLFGLSIGGLTGGSFDMQGSYLIDSAARAHDVCSYLFTMEGKDHPTDDYGIEYFKSVLNRLAVRMHAVIHDRSFCCPLELNVQPLDTLYYQQPGNPVSLSASVKNDNGQVELTWCAIPCHATGSSSTFEIEPDTSLRYIACIAYEDQCQAATINMVRAGTPDSIGSSIYMNAEKEQPLKVYPLPVSSTLTVSANFAAPLNQAVSLEIHDLSGRQVYKQETFVVDNLREQIDVQGLRAGSYLMSVFSRDIALRQKLIICR